jgi:peptidylprolyl isomerase/FKBP-type peptidyl-prolyl cis-trans isomerase FklB
MKMLFAALVACLFLGACAAGGPDPAATEGKAFLATNAKATGVVSLPSGLQYKIIKSGPATGLKPGPQDEVKVHYEGKLISGQVFDSSYERGAPAALPLPALIPAWIEALQLMRPGDVWMLYVPPELGYGDAGAGDIPPNSTLIFKIELIGILPAPGRIQQG